MPNKLRSTWAYFLISLNAHFTEDGRFTLNSSQVFLLPHVYAPNTHKNHEMTNKMEGVHPLGVLKWIQMDQFLLFCIEYVNYINCIILEIVISNENSMLAKHQYLNNYSWSSLSLTNQGCGHFVPQIWKLAATLYHLYFGMEIAMCGWYK